MESQILRGFQSVKSSSSVYRIVAAAVRCLPRSARACSTLVPGVCKIQKVTMERVTIVSALQNFGQCYDDLKRLAQARRSNGKKGLVDLLALAWVT